MAGASLADFVRLGWRHIDPAVFVNNWHLDVMCEHLESVTNGEIRRLLINIPPRHMKSLLCGVAWPAWTWLQDPDPQRPLAGPGVGFMYLAYAQALTIRDGLKQRRLMASDWYQDQWRDRFRILKNTEIRFDNDQKGYRINTSIDGGLATGEGADVQVIDDPHNVVDGESDEVREGVVSSFREALQSRYNNPATFAQVVIMQRVHARDLSGAILTGEDRDTWTHLCLPARYEHDHPNVWKWDRRKDEGDGALLWKDRMDEPALKRLEAGMGGPYAIAGQMQQRPGPRGGGMFKRANFEIVRSVPKIVKLARGWDFAMTEKAKGNDPDWTAGVKIGLGSDDVYYVLDVVRFRVGPGHIVSRFKSTISQDGTSCWVILPQDPGAGGKHLAASMVKAAAGYMVKAEPVGTTVKGNKEMRATPFASQADEPALNVKLLQGDWNEDFLAELAGFPTGAHDDQVDAAADAFNFVAGIVPGEGLIEFYRREAEKAGRRARGELEPVDDEDMIALIPPPGQRAATGLSGEMYYAGSDGLIRVRPEDVGPLANAIGWKRAPVVDAE